MRHRKCLIRIDQSLPHVSVLLSANCYICLLLKPIIRQVASNAITDSEFSNESGIYTIDDEFETDATSECVRADTNDNDLEIDTIFESVSDEPASNVIINTESSNEPGAYTIDDEFKTDTTSESGAISSSSQSSDNATSNGIIMNSISSGVRDTYTIDDKLEIQTMSESVDITIKIDLSTTSRSTPVTIFITTMSGDIKVKGQLTSTALQPPHRLCTINLHTMSGSIAADLPISTSTTIKSMSGKISASLHPINPMIPSDISLRNISGRIKLDVHPSILEPSAPLRLLSTKVKTTSGNARLIYPNSWEGKIEGKVGRSGTFKSYWPGLLVAREGSHMSATKGNGAGKLYISRDKHGG